jgi:hypothetical protein
MDLGKDLVAASATPLVLAILAEGESYGGRPRLPAPHHGGARREPLVIARRAMTRLFEGLGYPRSLGRGLARAAN